MKQTVEEAASENILFNHRTVDRTLSGKDLAKFGEMNFVQGAEWKSKQFTKATGMMFLRNRIKFFRPDGTRGDSPGCGSVLIAFGRENAEILRNCSLQGKYVELNNDK